MKVRYLLDTSVISEAIKRRPQPTLIAQLEDNLDLVAVASVTWHELIFGVGRIPDGKHRRRALQYLEQVLAPNLPTLPYDVAAAKWHADERLRLAAAGRTPPFVDGQIAAVAAVNRLAVVTSNARDFRHFKGLEVISWG